MKQSWIFMFLFSMLDFRFKLHFLFHIELSQAGALLYFIIWFLGGDNKVIFILHCIILYIGLLCVNCIFFFDIEHSGYYIEHVMHYESYPHFGQCYWINSFFMNLFKLHANLSSHYAFSYKLTSFNHWQILWAQNIFLHDGLVSAPYFTSCMQSVLLQCDWPHVQVHLLQPHEPGPADYGAHGPAEKGGYQHSSGNHASPQRHQRWLNKVHAGGEVQPQALFSLRILIMNILSAS